MSTRAPFAVVVGVAAVPGGGQLLPPLAGTRR